MVNHLTLESKLMKKTFEKEKNQAGVQVFNYNDTIQFVSNLKDKYPNFLTVVGTGEASRLRGEIYLQIILNL